MGYIKKVTCFLLLMIMSIGLSGCAEINDFLSETSQYTSINIKDGNVPMSNKAMSTFSSDLKLKYGTSEYMESAPFYNIEEDAKFQIHFNSNVSPIQAVTVHTDATCNMESIIYQLNDAYKNDNGVDIIVNPGKAVLSEEDGVWGKAPIYYLCIRYDMESTEISLLEEPVVIPFTIKSKISIPNAVAFVNENGQFGIQWNSVNNAVSYNIYQGTGINNVMSHGYYHETVKLIANVDSSENTFLIGENGNLGIGSNGYVYSENSEQPGTYYVVAVDSNGNESSFSKPIESSKYYNILPKRFEDQSIFEKKDGIATKLPTSVKIKMCDDTSSEYSISYDLKSEADGIATYIYKIDNTLLSGEIQYYNANGTYTNNINGGTIASAMFDIDNSIDIIPKNTVKTNKGTDYIKICTELPTTEKLDYSNELNNRREMELNRNKDGSYDISVFNFVDNDDTKNHYLYNNSVTTEFENKVLFADSAEEEYLAMCMVNAQTQIDLSSFPKLQNIEYMIDVLYKTIYQNPYIIGVSKFSYDADKAILHITYKKTSSEIKTQQDAVALEAESIIQNIITDDMDDETKIMAIWNYLENNTIYDNVACDVAKDSGFTNISGYDDSFSVYGIMVLKKGVCQSYMHTVKLLCYMSGINCKSLTGYLQYTTPHGWNMVEINGKWSWIDMTNNETNTGVPHFIYLTSYDFAKNSWGYVLDDGYEIDKYLSFAEVDNMDNDYYYSKGLYAKSHKDITDITASKIQEYNGIILIKCEFVPNINDKDFVDNICDALLKSGYDHSTISNTVYGNVGRVMIIDTTGKYFSQED